MSIANKLNSIVNRVSDSELVSKPLKPQLITLIKKALELGYTIPSLTNLYKLNNLIISLELVGIWNKLDTFYNFYYNGANLSNFATLNLKNPNNFQCTLLNSPAFISKGGFKGDAVSAYINTNFNPATNATNYTLNNASRFAWVTAAASSGANGIIDGRSSAGGNNFSANNVTTHRINSGVTNLNSAAFNNTTGFKIINRTSSTNIEIFENTTQTSRTATSSTIASESQTIFRSSSTYGNPQLAFYGMGASLVSENASFYNALNTYITSL